MKTSNDNVSSLDFDGLSRTGEYYAAAFHRGYPVTYFDRLAHSAPYTTIPEQQQEYLTAFQANPKNVAARRMQIYLMSIRSGSVAATALERRSDLFRKERMDERFAFAFYQMAASTMDASTVTTASAALYLTTSEYKAYKEQLNTLIEEAKSKYAELTKQITQGRARVSEQQAMVIDFKTKHAASEEQIAKSDAQINEIEEQYITSGRKSNMLENRAIKIVRTSFADYRNSIKGQETRPPEIYVKAQNTAPDGSIMYDRITRDEDGCIKIERVHESEVPELQKSDNALYCDMIERVYYHTDQDGKTELVRMEHGMNGDIMGRIGNISRDMIGQYMEVTGRTEQDITVDAKSYEEKITAQNALTATNEKLYETRRPLKARHKELAKGLNEAKSELHSCKAGLAEQESEAKQWSEAIDMLDAHCEHIDKIIELKSELQQKLNNGEFCSLDDMTCGMPEEYKARFLANVARLQHDHKAECAYKIAPPIPQCKIGEKGLNMMNVAWSKAMPGHDIGNNVRTSHYSAPSLSAEKVPVPV